MYSVNSFALANRLSSDNTFFHYVRWHSGVTSVFLFLNSKKKKKLQRGAAFSRCIESQTQIHRLDMQWPIADYKWHGQLRQLRSTDSCYLNTAVDSRSWNDLYWIVFIKIKDEINNSTKCNRMIKITKRWITPKLIVINWILTWNFHCIYIELSALTQEIFCNSIASNANGSLLVGS